MKELTTLEAAKRLAAPNGPEKLMDRPEEAFAACYALFCEGSPAACAFLCRCAKRKELRERINALLGPERTALKAALESGSPKLRKNAARLCGLLGVEADVPLVIAALQKEDTRFARPSMLLALGALGGKTARAFLDEYTVAPAITEAERAHETEEREALSTAKKSFLTLQKHAFTKLAAPCEIELRAPDKLADGLAAELEQAGYSVAAVRQSSVRLHTDDLAGLFSARCFSELLFEIAAGVPPEPKLMAIKAHAFMMRVIPSSHAGKPPYGYRIEIRGERQDRAALAKDMIRYIDSANFVNSPGDYEFELRVELRQNGSANLFLKLYTLPDHRFDYRIGALPASMHPVTAAAVLRYAKEYLCENARVLDPCCGSGTFLIEREKLGPCASLTGVDIAHKAIDIARENAIAAQSRAKFIVNDCLRFEAERPYDELIANLPFGNRVGSHNDNLRLYAALLDRLPQWVKRGGTALLYTMEYTLLKKLIRERPRLKLVTEVRTDAGGLMPAVFVIKVS